MSNANLIDNARRYVRAFGKHGNIETALVANLADALEEQLKDHAVSIQLALIGMKDLKGRASKLEHALEFYTSTDNYDWLDGANCSAVDRDRGSVGRKALTTFENPEPV